MSRVTRPQFPIGPTQPARWEDWTTVAATSASDEPGISSGAGSAVATVVEQRVRKSNSGPVCYAAQKRQDDEYQIGFSVEPGAGDVTVTVYHGREGLTAQRELPLSQLAHIALVLSDVEIAALLKRRSDAGGQSM